MYAHSYNIMSFYVSISGGVLSHSLALITDATHLASDLAGFLVSLLAIWLAEKQATTKMTYGYYRTGLCELLTFIIN